MKETSEKFAFYNVGIDGFKKDPLTFYFRLARYKFIWRALKAEDRVLDLAAGDGVGSYLLSAKAEYVLGMDVEDDFVAYARSEFKKDNLEFRRGDALEDDFGADWDVICLVGLLEYLDDEKSACVVEKISRALKPGGLAFIGTPNAHSLVIATERRKTTHHRELDAKGLWLLLEPHFSRVELFGQNDEFILPAVAEMSFFLMSRCQR